MFARGDFSSQTQRAVTLQKGEHRRHIISYHLLHHALEGWCDANGVDADTRSSVADHLRLMNNYIPNLHPGNGAVNSGIGMFTNNAAKTIRAGKFRTPQEFGQQLGKYRGFQIQTQRQLIDPVLTAFNTADIISGHMQAATTFGHGLVDSTDFDWPAGANPLYWQTWEEMYLVFLQIRKNPRQWPLEYLARAIDTFLTLPDPVRS